MKQLVKLSPVNIEDLIEVLIVCQGINNFQ